MSYEEGLHLFSRNCSFLCENGLWAQQNILNYSHNSEKYFKQLLKSVKSVLSFCVLVWFFLFFFSWSLYPTMKQVPYVMKPHVNLWSRGAHILESFYLFINLLKLLYRMEVSSFALYCCYRDYKLISNLGFMSLPERRFVMTAIVYIAW